MVSLLVVLSFHSKENSLLWRSSTLKKAGYLATEADDGVRRKHKECTVPSECVAIMTIMAVWLGKGWLASWVSESTLPKTPMVGALGPWQGRLHKSQEEAVPC